MIEDCLSTYNSVISIWGGFQNNTLKDILYIFDYYHQFTSRRFFFKFFFSFCKCWLNLILNWPPMCSFSFMQFRFEHPLKDRNKERLWPVKIKVFKNIFSDRAERHFFTLALIFHSSILLPSFIRREEKRGK